MDIRQRVKSTLLNFRFVYIFVTTILFFSQFAYFYIKSAFGMPTLMRTQNGILHQYISSPKLVIEFSLFILAQILVSVVFFGLTYWVIQKNKKFFNLTRAGEFLLGFLILSVAVFAVLFTNNYYKFLGAICFLVLFGLMVLCILNSGFYAMYFLL